MGIMAGASDRRRRGLFALFTVLVILTVLYIRGTLDPMLYRFGLNHYPCTHNGGGHVMCGAGVVGTPYGLRLGTPVLAVAPVPVDRPA